MTKTKSLKKALIASCLSLVMCLSMLVGTTFAWFTDSVTNNVNQIVSGNLDVELHHTKNYNDDATAYEVVGSDTALYDNLVWVHGTDSHEATMWQPNVISTEGFKIENKGSLPLQYKFSLNFVNATKTPAGKTLADVLVITVEDANGAVAGLSGETVLKNFVYTGTLNAGETYEFTTNIAWAQSANDNDYNVAGGLSIDIGVCVVASQLNDKVKIVGSNAEAQAALDNATADTTIYLMPGVNYGSLKIQPVVGNSNTVTDTDYSNYRNEYFRTVENLTIIGATGATIDNFEIVTGNQNNIWYYVDIKNLVIDSVEFSANTPMYPARSYTSPLLISLSSTRVDGLTIKNCKIDGKNGKQNVVYFNDVQASNSTFETYAKNVTITGNTVSNVERLCELRETENLTITNNTITSTAQHTILLSTNSGKTYSGDVIITGNTSNYSYNRFVRMSGAGDANVVIKDNNVNYYLGTEDVGLETHYIKVTNSTGSVTIENNPLTTAVGVKDVDTLKTAITNAVDGDLIVITNDITISENWDSRFGGTTAADVTINGLGHTLKFTTKDKNTNYNAVLVLNGNATVQNLNFDLSDSAKTSISFYAIASAANLTVDNCAFIGSVTNTKDNAIIFGLGSTFDSNKQNNLSVSVTNCTFSNSWRRCISDNEGGKDIKDLVVSGNTFINTTSYAMNASAHNSLTLTNNTFVGKGFIFTSYTNAANVTVVATGNTLNGTGCQIGYGSQKFDPANLTVQEGIYLVTL